MINLSFQIDHFRIPIMKKKEDNTADSVGEKASVSKMMTSVIKMIQRGKETEGAGY